MTRIGRIATFVVLAVASGTAAAQVKVDDAWVRATVEGQQATGAFMRIVSTEGGALVAASSPAASVVELHEMKMEGNMMKMSAVPRVELPAGRPVELKPGGYHIMLINLKAPLKAGQTIPLRLRIESKGVTREIEVRAQVRGPSGAGMH